MSNQKERLVYIDVLRVIAMFSVITFHYMGSLDARGIVSPVQILPTPLFCVDLGGFGTSIFFILSGAALMYTYSGKLDIRKYVKSRILGIFPMFYLAYFIAFLYLFYQNVGFFRDVPLYRFILTPLAMDGYFWSYAPNFYILGEWFLGCLIFLYILFPFVKKGIEKHPVITGVVILILFVLSIVFHNTPMPTEQFVFSRLLEFAFGMYFVHYGSKVPWPVALGALLYLISACYIPYGNLVTYHMIRYSSVGISVFLIITFACKYISKVPLLIKIFGIIGKYSYPVFLVHHVIADELARHFQGKVLSMRENYILYILFLVLTFVFAFLLFKLNKKIIGSFSISKKPK